MHLVPAEVAPLAPGIAYGLAALGSLLAFLVCWGLRHAWEATLGYGLRWVASKIRGVGFGGVYGVGSVHPFNFLADKLEEVDKTVSHYLAVAAINTERAFVYCADQTAEMFVWAGKEIYGTALALYGFALRMEKVELPHLERRFFKWAHHAIDAVIHPLRAETRQLERDIRREERAAATKIRHAEHAATHALDWSEQKVGVIDHDLARLRARTRSLEDGAVKTFDWLRSHSKGAAFGTFVAAVALALERLGLDFVKCPEFGAVTRKWKCGLWKLLDTLLPLAVFLTIGFDFPDFVRAAQLVADGIGDAVAAIEGDFELSLPPLPPPQ